MPDEPKTTPEDQTPPIHSVESWVKQQLAAAQEPPTDSDEPQPPKEEPKEEPKPKEEPSVDGVAPDAEAKRLEAENARLRAQVEAQRDKDTLEPPVAAASNPFREVTTREALQQQSVQVGEMIKFTENLLRTHKDAPATEVIYVDEASGREWTRGQIEDVRAQNVENRDTFLPARLGDIKRLEAQPQLRAQEYAKAQGELPWTADKESPEWKKMSELAGSEFVARVRAQAPEVEHLLDYLIPHAAASIAAVGKPAEAARPKPAEEEAKKPEAMPSGAPTPPVTPKSAMTGATAGETNTKAVNEIESRIGQFGGSIEDHVQLAMARAQSRAK